MYQMQELLNQFRKSSKEEQKQILDILRVRVVSSKKITPWDDIVLLQMLSKEMSVGFKERRWKS